MALRGNWKKFDAMTSAAGKPFIVVELEYKGDTWGKLSTFDKNIIATAEALNEGDPVIFETRKSGKYTNLITLEIDDGTAPTTPAQTSPKKTSNEQFKSKVRSPEEDLRITAIALFKSSIEGGIFTTIADACDHIDEVFALAKLIVNYQDTGDVPF
jgi:hypothetical protein